jgi:hypothetical protein
MRCSSSIIKFSISEISPGWLLTCDPDKRPGRHAGSHRYKGRVLQCRTFGLRLFDCNRVDEDTEGSLGKYVGNAVANLDRYRRA